MNLGSDKTCSTGWLYGVAGALRKRPTRYKRPGWCRSRPRSRHRRLFAVAALTLLVEAQNQDIDPADAVGDLPALLDDPTAKELAGCVEIQAREDAEAEPGSRELVAIRGKGCNVWIDESLRWPLPAPAGVD